MTPRKTGYFVGCFWIILALVLAGCRGHASDIRQQIEAAVSSFRGDVGVALISGADTVLINGDERFPMFSVVKFHQALSVCEALRQNNIPLDSTIHVTAEDLRADTWSPMRKSYPLGGDFVLPDGRHIELAVFIKNANCSPEECEELTAEIAEIVY